MRHIQTSHKHASLLWCTDTAGNRLLSGNNEALGLPYLCQPFPQWLLILLKKRQRDYSKRGNLFLCLLDGMTNTLAHRDTLTSISWWVTSFEGRPWHKERMRGLKITTIIPMESEARPCLDALQRQVHMTFGSQAEPGCCALVKCVTSRGRNWDGNAKRNVLERHASVWQERLCKRGATMSTHTHTQASWCSVF